MSEDTQDYFEFLKKFVQFQNDLFSLLERVVVIPKSTQELGIVFMPNSKTILEQIKKWPLGTMLLPPVAWVEPRQGSVIYNGQKWDFGFHGVGLSFFENKARTDITIDFSATGELGVTKENFLTYLQSLKLQENFHDMGEKHSVFFAKLREKGVLKEIPPLFPHSDQTYLLIDI